MPIVYEKDVPRIRPPEAYPLYDPTNGVESREYSYTVEGAMTREGFERLIAYYGEQIDGYKSSANFNFCSALIAWGIIVGWAFYRLCRYLDGVSKGEPDLEDSDGDEG